LWAIFFFFEIWVVGLPTEVLFLLDQTCYENGKTPRKFPLLFSFFFWKTLFLCKICTDIHSLVGKIGPFRDLRVKVAIVNQLVRLLVSVSAYQSGNSIFLSQQTSTSRAYQPRNQPANRPPMPRRHRD